MATPAIGTPGGVRPARTTGRLGSEEFHSAPLPTAERLRPEWTKRWIANPQRLFTYSPLMPQNFPRDSVKYQDYLVGSSLQQAEAVRDVLMDLPRLADLPGVRDVVPPPPAPTGGGK